MFNLIIRRVAAPLLTVLCLVSLSGCGNLTDKDLIVIAKLDGESIRRGDLRKLIRDMDDDKRPVIHNRADLLRVLNRHIDETILQQAAQDLRAEQKIEVPREQATAIYFTRHPDDLPIYEVPSADELHRQDIAITEGELAAFKADIEFKIDDVEEELYRNQALSYLVQDAVQTGRMTVTEEEFQQEYEIFKDSLMHFEQAGFVGVRFNSTFANAAEKAAECREELAKGRSFEQLLNFYYGIDPSLIFESMIENNPGLPRFRSFWEKVSGAKVGDVFGPLYLPEYDMAERLPDGTLKHTNMPAAYVVIQITAHVPPRPKNLEESKADLAPQILRRKMMRQLREEHGVEIYEDKLPDPGRYDTEKTGPFVDVDY